MKKMTGLVHNKHREGQTKGKNSVRQRKIEIGKERESKKERDKKKEILSKTVTDSERDKDRELKRDRVKCRE